MLAFAAGLLLVATPGAPMTPPPVASSAAFARKPKMAVLFRRYDGFFPAWCVKGRKLRAGSACVELLPRAPVVRRMSGERLALGPLGRLNASAWDAAPRPGWSLPDTDAGEADDAPETELAVWPPDANPGLEPPTPSTRPVDLEGLRALPKSDDEGYSPLKQRARTPPAWPPTVEQVIELGAPGRLVVSGARRGLFLQAPDGWRAVRTEGPAEVGTAVLGSADLDGDGRAEWLVFIKGWNEFGLEVWTDDFRKPLFVFNDCGV